MTFNELNLSAPLLRAIAEAGYETLLLEEIFASLPDSVAT